MATLRFDTWSNHTDLPQTMGTIITLFGRLIVGESVKIIALSDANQTNSKTHSQRTKIKIYDSLKIFLSRIGPE